MSSRKKTILIAYDLSPSIGSESRKANNWLKIISKHYDVDVFTDAFHREAIIAQDYPNVTFHFIEGSLALREFLWKFDVINVSYTIFCTKLRRAIQTQLQKKDSSLIHCITPAAIYSYNDLYKFDVPVLVGPLGGALKTPEGFKKAFRSQAIKNSLRDIYYRFFMKTKGWKEYFLKAKRIIIGTHYMLDVLPSEVHHKTTVLFDTCVDKDVFVPLDHKKINPVKRIIFSGQLDSKKGVLLLIEAVKLCLQKGVSNFVVELAGRGALEDNLKQMIKIDQLDNHVKLLGFLGQKELIKKYQESDIYCLPTLREPGGGAILEAMACGLPIITSNYGGPAFSVTEECGIKIEMTDYDTYARDLGDAIIELVTNDERRIKLGLKARERVEKEFSLQALERQIADIYKQVIKE